MQAYATQSARIGRYKGQFLKHAIPVELLSRDGRHIDFPANNSDTYVARRCLPFGATATNANTMNRFYTDGTGDRGNVVVQAHQTQEGITGDPDSISFVDVSVTLVQYDCLYGFTDKTFKLYEDDVPAEMQKQVGERITWVNELIIYGALRQCTNVYYGGSGTSIATVDGTITLNMIRKVTKNLDANHARMVNQQLAPSKDFATAPVEAGFNVYAHTNLNPDIRSLDGFIHIKEYASGKPRPHELGAAEDFRFFTTPDLPELQDAGAAVGVTGLTSTNGVNIDVYPVLVIGADAWSHVAVRGLNSIDPTYLPPGKKDKADPQGQRGYAGAKWWKAVMLENHGWMAVLYVGSAVVN